MVKSRFIHLLAFVFLGPWPLQVLVRWQQVRHRCLESVDFQLRAGATVILVGVSGSGKSTLLQLLAEGTPEEAAEFYFDPCLLRPMEVIDPDALRATVARERDLQQLAQWPLRLRFAADMHTAARKSNFATVSATHCLAADVSWLRDSCDEVWILEQRRFRRLSPQKSNEFEEIKRYAALRSRMGSVNS
eukprot:g2519.t1